MEHDPLITVSVRIPKSMTARVKRLAAEQDRTAQAVYTRALRFGLDLEEERHRIACEAIKAAERRATQRQEAPDGE
jgi:predicted transcriptional regulator